MDFEVVWTEPAVADLEAITTYIAEHNPAAAEKTAAAILDRVEGLRTVPLIGVTYPRDRRGRIGRSCVGNTGSSTE
jgi:plasmid stabilization system protein ParE